MDRTFNICTLGRVRIANPSLCSRESSARGGLPLDKIPIFIISSDESNE
jgi:hypothetical protein